MLSQELENALFLRIFFTCQIIFELLDVKLMRPGVPESQQANGCQRKKEGADEEGNRSGNFCRALFRDAICPVSFDENELMAEPERSQAKGGDCFAGVGLRLGF